MKVLFLGLLYNRDDEKILLKSSKVGLQAAANEYEWNFIDALKCKGIDITILNVLPVGTFPKKYKKLFLKSKNWEYKNSECKELGTINIPILKEIIRKIKIKKYLKKYINENSKPKIISYSLYIPFLKALYELKKEGYKFEYTLIITDFHGKYGIYSNNKIYRLCQDYAQRKSIQLTDVVDKYILLTEQMNEIINPKNKPYCIVEGIGKDIKSDNEKINLHSKKSLVYFYAGTLNYKYGLKEFIDEFIKLDQNNAELWIAGKGDLEKYIKEMSEKYMYIKYFGFLSKNEVIEKEQQATILINPRQNEGEYTKYSFPSKIFEYMSTGTTILMNRLDGIPEEYYKYVLTFKPTLKETITSINNMTMDEIKNIGIRAKIWLIENKGNDAFREKIIKFLKQ